MLRHKLLGTLLLLSSLPVLAAPYEGLVYALRKEKIASDIKDKCGYDKKMSTDVLQKKVTAVPENTQTILAAASSLRKNNKESYSANIDNVKCPQ